MPLWESLSPDGKWVLTLLRGEWVLLPAVDAFLLAPSSPFYGFGDGDRVVAQSILGGLHRECRLERRAG